MAAPSQFDGPFYTRDASVVTLDNSGEESVQTKLFALGSNGSGQLGLGHVEDVSSPQEVALPRALHHGHIQRIVTGGNHTLLLAEDNTVYGCGLPTYSWNPEPLPDAYASRFKLINSSIGEDPHRALRSAGVEVVGCAATWEGSVLVKRKNALSADPDNSDNEHAILVAGNSVETKNRQTHGFTAWMNQPTSVFSVIDVSAGMSHTAMITQGKGDPANKVWCWGRNNKGQVSKEAARVQDIPVHPSGIDFNPFRVVCGQYFTCIVGDKQDGSIKIIGSDRHGIISDCPTTIKGYKSIAASWGSIYVLFDDGRMVSWGRSDRGQLCPPDLPLIDSFAAGSEHVVAITKFGKIISWGWGEHGNCGIPVDDAGDVKGRFNELVLPANCMPYYVAAGCATTFIAVTIDRPS